MDHGELTVQWLVAFVSKLSNQYSASARQVTLTNKAKIAANKGVFMKVLVFAFCLPH
jgi:hypothetical protein